MRGLTIVWLNGKNKFLEGGKNMTSYYMQLKPIVGKYLEYYKDDFFKHDRKTLTHKLDGNDFIFAMRKTGTNIFVMEEKSLMKR